MLSRELQLKVLGLLREDLSIIDRFWKHNIEIKEQMFDNELVKIFQVIVKAKEKGYNTLTNDFLELHNIGNDWKISGNDTFLDVSNRIKEELHKKIIEETNKKLSIAWKEYSNSSIEEQPEKLRKLQEIVSQTPTVQVEDTGKNLYEIVKESFKYSQNHLKIPTFLNQLDEEVLLGGITRRGITLFSARSGGGKTTSAVQIATNMASNGYKVRYYSLEQPAEKIAGNVLSVLSNTKEMNRQYWDTSLWKEADEKEKPQIALNLIDEYLGKNFVIDDQRYETTDEFVESVKRSTLEFDVIIVDNFQNCPVSDESNVEQSFRKLADRLDNIIANSRKTAMVCLTQLSGQEGNEKPFYSSRLLHHSHTHLKMYRVEKDENDLNYQMGIKPLKVRFGKEIEEDLKLRFLPSRSIIGEYILPKKNEEKHKKHDIKEDLEEMMETGIPIL